MTKRVEILVSFRGDPNETGHAETYFREGEFPSLSDAFADLIIGKRLAAAAPATAEAPAVPSPPPPAPPVSNDGGSK